MGCCQHIPLDYYTYHESSLELSSVTLAEFASILAETGDKKLVSREDLALAMAETKFGAELVDVESNLMRLLSYEVFHPNGEEHLAKQALFALGVLYCSGTQRQKKQAIFAQFDGNQDGKIAINPIKKLCRQVIHIAAVAIPACSNEQQELAEDTQKNEVEDLVEQLVADIVKNSIILTEKEFLSLAHHRINLILHGALLRRQFARVSQADLQLQ